MQQTNITMSDYDEEYSSVSRHATICLLCVLVNLCSFILEKLPIPKILTTSVKDKVHLLRILLHFPKKSIFT